MNRVYVEGCNLTLLAQEVKKSDRKSFSTLFELLWEPMYAYANAITMDENVSKDLVQDLWMDYWNRRESIEAVNIKSYLFKAIRYKCLNYLRNTKFNQTHIEVEDKLFKHPEIDELYDMLNLTRYIEASTSELPKRCREIFLCSRINQLSNGEIAKKLNVSKHYVENQLSRALTKIRKDLALVKSILFF
ncbi:RNA polymerase sigma-70 factor [Flagellimonas sp. 2504JD1-5]